MRDIFWSQGIDSSPTRGDKILDLTGSNVSELVLNIKIGGSLGCSALVESAVLRDMGQVRNKVRPLNFRKADFQLFKEIASEIHWETSLREKGVEHSWQIFKEVFHRVQEMATPRSKKLGKEGKGTAGLSRELLVRLEGKKQMHRQLKLGWVAQEEPEEVKFCCEGQDEEVQAKTGTELGKGHKE